MPAPPIRSFQALRCSPLSRSPTAGRSFSASPAGGCRSRSWTRRSNQTTVLWRSIEAGGCGAIVRIALAPFFCSVDLWDTKSELVLQPSATPLVVRRRRRGLVDGSCGCRIHRSRLPSCGENEGPGARRHRLPVGTRRPPPFAACADRRANPGAAPGEPPILTGRDLSVSGLIPVPLVIPLAVRAACRPFRPALADSLSQQC
jgi:hypothetical protein